MSVNYRVAVGHGFRLEKAPDATFDDVELYEQVEDALRGTYAYGLLSIVEGGHYDGERTVSVIDRHSSIGVSTYQEELLGTHTIPVSTNLHNVFNDFLEAVKHVAVTSDKEPKLIVSFSMS